VYIELNKYGSVANCRLMKSSGDSTLDTESVAIVLRAAPFPKPTLDLLRFFIVVVRFSAHGEVCIARPRRDMKKRLLEASKAKLPIKINWLGDLDSNQD
jgi:TonB family protein